ncbi:MAG: peptidylprolyl isomerase [Planctomycetota bacterium]|jgi:peptidyl-prolyl cis-trans isomerase C
MKRCLTISACLVILVAAFSCRQKPSAETEKEVVEPNQKAKAAPDEIAVIVNGRIVTEGQVEAEIEKVAALTKPEYFEKYRDRIRKQALDRVIILKLLEEEVEKAKMVATEEEVLEKIREFAAQQNLSLDEFKETLKAAGMNFDEWKREMQIEVGIKFQKLIEATMGDQLNVTEADANNFYSANIELFQEIEQVKVSHIFVRPDPNTDPNEAKAKALAKARDLLKQIKEGADFAELAKATGGYPSASRGGDLGFRPRGAWDAVFEKVAFELKIGQTSDIVETQFGYHIIRVTDRKEADIKSFEQTKDDIIKMLKRKKQRPFVEEYIESLKASAKIVYPPGKEPPLVPDGS